MEKAKVISISKLKKNRKKILHEKKSLVQELEKLQEMQIEHYFEVGRKLYEIKGKLEKMTSALHADVQG